MLFRSVSQSRYVAAVENGEVVAKVEGSGKMTTELFQKTIDAFKNGDLD